MRHDTTQEGAGLSTPIRPFRILQPPGQARVVQRLGEAGESHSSRRATCDRTMSQATTSPLTSMKGVRSTPE